MQINDYRHALTSQGLAAALYFDFHLNRDARAPPKIKRAAHEGKDTLSETIRLATTSQLFSYHPPVDEFQADRVWAIAGRKNLFKNL